MYYRQVFVITAGTLMLALSGCNFVASLTPISGNNSQASSSINVDSDRFSSYIRGKLTSNLSEDRKTITLSVDTASDDLKIEWTQDNPSYGSLNSDRGQAVQWTALRAGDYQAVLTASVSKGTETPDVAHFVIPVVDGKIVPSEIAPELTLAPQSLILFRTLPLSLQQSKDTLHNLGVDTEVQLMPTTYIYDKTSNTKVKQSGDSKEIKWLSADPGLVCVDDNGLVSPAAGSKVGRTIVTATSKTNSASNAMAQIRVQYLDASIDFSYPTSTIYLTGKGTPNTVTIGATVTYSNPEDRNRVIFQDTLGREISWSSSNQSIAQVDALGKVTPQADAATGDVSITATSNYDPSKSKSVTIHVLDNSSNINVTAH